MRIAVVTIAYSSSASVQSLLDTMSADGHAIECHLFLHSKYPQLTAACDSFARHPAVIYHRFGCNRGVSKSWNDGMLAAYGRHCDVVIVANDDISFGAGDIARLAAKAAAHRDSYIVTCAGYHLGHRRRIPSVGYACFAINPVAVKTLGCFDENFFPAYCEDQDYGRRATLAGLHEENCAETQLSHVGSNCILSDPALRLQNSSTHGRNRLYYRRKWGGFAGEESYSRPFNDPRLGVYIDPRHRQNPYGPSYDRSDGAIVVL